MKRRIKRFHIKNKEAKLNALLVINALIERINQFCLIKVGAIVKCIEIRNYLYFLFLFQYQVI